MSSSVQRNLLKNIKPSQNPRIADPDSTTTEILRNFNTWAFKREQPSEPEMLAATIASRVAADLPVSFVLYWGKGPRAQIAAPDLACLDFLNTMGSRIGQAYDNGAEFHLCLTDTHARLNGHAEAAIASYYAGIKTAAAARNMKTCHLSELVKDEAPEIACDNDRESPMLTALEQCATRWFRGDGKASDGARTYLAMNRVESRAVATNYPDSIFLSFNGRAFRDLFPATMPVFYMYSIRRGTAVKPWFMDAEGRPFTDADELGHGKST